jgi:hypothetical protein
MSAIGEHSTQEAGAAGSPATRPRRATSAVLRGVLGLIGALSLVGGLTWLLLNMHGPHPAVDLLVGVVLSAGGLVLLMPHRFKLPGLAGAAGAAVVAILGTGAGLAVNTTQICCAFAYAESRGFPWPLMQRAAAAGTPETARNLALAANWQLDAISLVAGLLFWAHTGLLLVAATVLARRAWTARHPRT